MKSRCQLGFLPLEAAGVALFLTLSSSRGCVAYWFVVMSLWSSSIRLTMSMSIPLSVVSILCHLLISLCLPTGIHDCIQSTQMLWLECKVTPTSLCAEYLVPKREHDRKVVEPSRVIFYRRKSIPA